MIFLAFFVVKDATSYIIIVFCANIKVMSEYPVAFDWSERSAPIHKR